MSAAAAPAGPVRPADEPTAPDRRAVGLPFAAIVLAMLPAVLD